TVQGFNQEAHGHGKSSQFGSSTDDQGDGGWGALVNVRCPHVERSRRQFESQTGNHKHHTEDQSQTLGLTVGDDFSDAREFQMAGSAKNHGHTVQQDTRCQSTQHEVLQSRFNGLTVFTTQRNQCVQRKGHQLHTQISGQHAVGRNHDHLAQQSHQSQGVEFTTAFHHVALFGVLTTVDQGSGHGYTRKQLQKVRQLVCDEQATKRDTAHALGPLPGYAGRNHGKRQQAQNKRRVALFVFAESIKNQHTRSQNQEQDLGQSQRKVKGSIHSDSAYSFEMETCCSNASTETCMTSVNGLGYTPMPSTAIAITPRTKNSRPLRSLMPATLSLPTGPKATRLSIHSE